LGTGLVIERGSFFITGRGKHPVSSALRQKKRTTGGGFPGIETRNPETEELVSCWGGVAVAVKAPGCGGGGGARVL